MARPLFNQTAWCTCRLGIVILVLVSSADCKPHVRRPPSAPLISQLLASTIWAISIWVMCSQSLRSHLRRRGLVSLGTNYQISCTHVTWGLACGSGAQLARYMTFVSMWKTGNEEYAEFFDAKNNTTGPRHFRVANVPDVVTKVGVLCSVVWEASF